MIVMGQSGSYLLCFGPEVILLHFVIFNNFAWNYCMNLSCFSVNRLLVLSRVTVFGHHKRNGLLTASRITGSVH